MGGHPADLDALTELARRKNIALIEDSSHAHASEWRSKKIGSYGVAGTFSFQSSKLMTAGEGGMIISNDDTFERHARAVHDCGRMPGEWFYSHFIYGSNYRLSEWQGAVLMAQLGRLDEQTRRRHQNSRVLDRELGKIPGITPQKLDERCTRNGQYAYIFHVDKNEFAGISTDRFVAAMNEEGIPNQASYPPLHELHMFRNGEYRKCLSGAQAKDDHAFLKESFPHTQRAAWETVWIPQPALLGDDEDMEEIVGAIRKIQRHAKDLAIEKSHAAPLAR
jgi:dTDP-4-amino-4,6-dideoxygalactose transaminase